MKADFYLLIHLSPCAITWTSLGHFHLLTPFLVFILSVLIPVSQFQLHLHLHLQPFVILNLILHHFTIPKPHFLRSHHVL